MDRSNIANESGHERNRFDRMRFKRYRIAFIALGILLVIPSVWGGLSMDDFVQLYKSDGVKQIIGNDYGPLDQYSFSTGDPDDHQRNIESGLFPWWTSKKFKATFLRPLSSLALVLDYYLFDNDPVWKHIHSILWYFLLLIAVAVLYKRLHANPVAFLALLLFCIDDAHGVTVGFIANRHALISAFFGVMALIAFDRFYRDRWLKGQWLAPFYLILSLMAGEAGLAFFAFIFSYVLFIHRGGVWNKMTLLIPYTLLFFSWAALYWINDLGTQGSGMYINPIGEPLSFLFLMIQRLPILLFGLFGFLASDLWLLYPPGIDTLVLSIALIFLLAFFILLSPGLKRNRLLRFWLLATVLALLPLSATFPSDRNLIIPGIAGMAILAHLIRLHVRRFQYRKWVGRAGTTSGKKIRRFSTNLLLIVLFISHLIAAPIQRPIRANTFRTMMRFIERSDSFIPSTPEIKRKTVILLNYPFDLLILYLPIFRSFYGIPGPEKILLLKSGIDEILVNRISKNTLRIRVPGGYLSHRMDLLFRSPDERMEVGDRIQLKEMAIKVVEVNSRGMPMELELVFSGSPEDSDFLWLCCRKNLDLSPFSIPAVGKNVRIKTEIDLPAGFRHLFQ